MSMTDAPGDLRRAVLDALCLETVDDAAEQLAALRAYAHRRDGALEPSRLRFDTVRARERNAEPWYRRTPALAAMGGLGAAVAVALAMALWPPATPESGVRLKGESSCCGSVRLRVGLVQGGSVGPLPSRVVAAGSELGADFALAGSGWPSLYDVHLPRADEQQAVNATLTRSPTDPLSRLRDTRVHTVAQPNGSGSGA